MASDKVANIRRPQPKSAEDIALALIQPRLEAVATFLKNHRAALCVLQGALAHEEPGVARDAERTLDSHIVPALSDEIEALEAYINGAP